MRLKKMLMRLKNLSMRKTMRLKQMLMRLKKMLMRLKKLLMRFKISLMRFKIKLMRFKIKLMRLHFLEKTCPGGHVSLSSLRNRHFSGQKPLNRCIASPANHVDNVLLRPAVRAQFNAL